jgi:hypothetical protein
MSSDKIEKSIYLKTIIPDTNPTDATRWANPTIVF